MLGLWCCPWFLDCQIGAQTNPFSILAPFQVSILHADLKIEVKMGTGQMGWGWGVVGYFLTLSSISPTPPHKRTLIIE